MTRKPLKSWSRLATFPPTSSQDRSLFCPGLTGKPVAGLMVLMLLMVFTGCHSHQEYQILDSPFPVTDRWGKERPYRVYLPPLKQKMPVLVYFHGVMSEGFKFIPSLKNYTGSPVEETGLIGFCRRNGIILVVPRAVYTYKFLGKTASGWLPFDRECPGIERIIDVLVKNVPVSEGQIFLAGISAGAGMCHHLANRRPGFYSAVLSHSQGYVDQDSRLLKPVVPGPQFGVVFAFTSGDYDNLIEICLASERIYREAGYQTVLLKDLPPKNHSWSKESNARFWRVMQAVGRQPVIPPKGPDPNRTR